MRVGICDDSMEARHTIEAICRQVMDKMQMEYEVLQFANGKELLAAVANIDLIILDIEMPEMNGLEVKQRLQGIDGHHMIIFVTNHGELISSAFGLHVFGFIMKENLDSQLAHMIVSAIGILEQHIYLNRDLDSRDVKYIKSTRVYCEVYLKDGTKQTLRVSLKELEKKLKIAGFIRTHRTYLVNLAYVDRISEREMYIGEDRIPVATRLRKEVIKEYQEFCERNARYC